MAGGVRVVGEPRFYYILDTRSCVGNCGLWWGPERAGYVCSIDEAGRYGEEEAFAIQRSRGTDVAMACEEVEALIVRHVRVDSDRFHALKDRSKRRRQCKPATPEVPPECSVCRSRHGREVEHASE